jgi:zinc transport system permease protein
MADSLAHISLAGVALGLLFGVYPVYTAILAAVVTAIIIERLRTERGVSGEVALAMFLSGGLAIAIVLIGLAKGFNVDLFSYLFGSITTVRAVDLWIISSLGIITLITIYFFYQELLYVSFDEEAAQVSGIPTKLTNLILVILTAITVSLSMRIVGTLLIGALMVIPVVAAMQIARSFKQILFFAIMFSLFATITGLTLSYYLNLAAGGTIVVLSLIVFGVISIFHKR